MEVCMNIRKAAVQDADAVSSLFKLIYKVRHPYIDKIKVAADFASEKIISYVSEENGVITGFGQLNKPEYNFFEYEDEAMEISRLATHPDFQGRGISSSIVSMLEHDFLAAKTLIATSNLTTVTDFSQRAVMNFDLIPTCLYRGLAPDLLLTGQSISVLSAIRFYRPVGGSTQVYIPSRYKQLYGYIYGNLRVQRTVGISGGIVSDNFVVEVAKHIARYTKMAEDANYNYSFLVIDITRTAACAEIDYAVKSGLSVDGIVPMLKDRDGKRKDRVIMRKVPPGIDEASVRVMPGLYEEFKHIIFNL
jgi:GNAT superfamily N-acetyltransferase